MSGIRRHSLWAGHPAITTDGPLTFGEGAADALKHHFGTWTALFAVFATIGAWIGLQQTGLRWDARPYIMLNLVLSCLAAVQGIILQISANRGDRLSAVIALHTESSTEVILDLQNKQMAILSTVESVAADVLAVRELGTGGTAAIEADIALLADSMPGAEAGVVADRIRARLRGHFPA